MRQSVRDDHCLIPVRAGLRLPMWSAEVLSLRFILVPTIGQIIDVFQSVLLGINNAAEKPYVPTKGST